MNRFWDQFIREPLRKILMRGLIFTEKRPSKPLYRRDSLLLRDIPIPPALVAVLAPGFVFIIFMFHIGWSWNSFISITALVLLLLALFVFYLHYDLPKLSRDDDAMMLLGTLMVLFSAVILALKGWPLSFYLTPIPAASVLATLLLHYRLSFLISMVLAAILGMIQGFSFECFAIALSGGLAGSASAIRIRAHRDFITVGAWVAGVSIVTASVMDLFIGRSVQHLIPEIFWVGLNGFGSAMIALGLLPFLESLFSRVTPLKLHELSDFNQPLLKRLMLEAPGTYHHSLMMATIAESAADAIGANALLCRVGAYYHDIGKLIKPEYFIENQGNVGYNPHGNLAPALSSLVVIQHVKEGMALARAAKLPQEIIDFIPMHHGTTRIEYFYQQAKEEAMEEALRNVPGQTEVEEESYRYPGPKPLTKETAILMLADSVEAAGRTLEDPTPVHIQDFVERIVQKRIEDGQLANAPLTLAELNKIQESFVKTLTSIYHSRIEYPEEQSPERE